MYWNVSLKFSNGYFISCELWYNIPFYLRPGEADTFRQSEGALLFTLDHLLPKTLIPNLSCSILPNKQKPGSLLSAETRRNICCQLLSIVSHQFSASNTNMFCFHMTPKMAMRGRTSAGDGCWCWWRAGEISCWN